MCSSDLFFASINDLIEQFEVNHDPDSVLVDMAAAHIWDASSVAAFDAIETKYGRRGKTVTIVGLNEHSAAMHGRLAGELSGSH